MEIKGGDHAFGLLQRLDTCPDEEILAMAAALELQTRTPAVLRLGLATLSDDAGRIGTILGNRPWLVNEPCVTRQMQSLLWAPGDSVLLDGMTGLMAAVEVDAMDAVRAFLDTPGVEVDHFGGHYVRSEENALSLATRKAWKGGGVSTIRTLRGAGADPLLPVGEGECMLFDGLMDLVCHPWGAGSELEKEHVLIENRMKVMAALIGEGVREEGHLDSVCLRFLKTRSFWDLAIPEACNTCLQDLTGLVLPTFQETLFVWLLDAGVDVAGLNEVINHHAPEVRAIHERHVLGARLGGSELSASRIRRL